MAVALRRRDVLKKSTTKPYRVVSQGRDKLPQRKLRRSSPELQPISAGRHSISQHRRIARKALLDSIEMFF
jgi:hypothetical protein